MPEHRRGATTTPTAPRRPNPSGAWGLRADTASHLVDSAPPGFSSEAFRVSDFRHVHPSPARPGCAWSTSHRRTARDRATPCTRTAEGGRCGAWVAALPARARFPRRRDTVRPAARTLSGPPRLRPGSTRGRVRRARGPLEGMVGREPCRGGIYRPPQVRSKTGSFFRGRSSRSVTGSLRFSAEEGWGGLPGRRSEARTAGLPQISPRVSGRQSLESCAAPQ